MQNWTPRTRFLVFLHTEISGIEWKPYTIYPRNSQRRLRCQPRDSVQQAGLGTLLTKHQQRQLGTFSTSLLSQSLRLPRMSKTGPWPYKCFWETRILLSYVCLQTGHFMDWAGLALWALREQRARPARRKYPLLCLGVVLGARNYHGTPTAWNQGISALGNTGAAHWKVDDVSRMWQGDSYHSPALSKLWMLIKALCLGKIPEKWVLSAVSEVPTWTHHFTFWCPGFPSSKKGMISLTRNTWKCVDKKSRMEVKCSHISRQRIGAKAWTFHFYKEHVY